jgi:hypothetical protein
LLDVPPDADSALLLLAPPHQQDVLLLVLLVGSLRRFKLRDKAPGGAAEGQEAVWGTQDSHWQSTTCDANGCFIRRGGKSSSEKVEVALFILG